MKMLLDLSERHLSTESPFEAALAVGTMVFMAPETFTNVNVELDQQTDVWALGVILMWMMTALQLLCLDH